MELLLSGISYMTWTCCLQIDNTGVQQTSVRIIHIYVCVCLCGNVCFCAYMDINDWIDNVGGTKLFYCHFVYHHLPIIWQTGIYVAWFIRGRTFTDVTLFIDIGAFSLGHCLPCVAWHTSSEKIRSVQKELARKIRLYHSNGFFTGLNRTHVEWGFQFDWFKFHVNAALISWL